MSTSAATMVRRDSTYYTISDAEFFVGTVMLVNSLRVTGNDGKLGVSDAGLDPGQRALLEPVTRGSRRYRGGMEQTPARLVWE